MVHWILGARRTSQGWHVRVTGEGQAGPRFHHSNIPERLCRLQRVRTFLGYRKRDAAQKRAGWNQRSTSTNLEINFCYLSKREQLEPHLTSPKSPYHQWNVDGGLDSLLHRKKNGSH